MTRTCVPLLSTLPKTCCGRKASPTSAFCRRRQRQSRAVKSTSIWSPQPGSSRTWMPETRSPRWPVCTSAAYELFAHEPIRTISDLRGNSVGIQRLGSNSHLLLSIMAAHVGLEPAHRHQLDHEPRFQPQGAVRRRQSGRFSWRAAEAAGAARPQDRPRDPQHGHGPAVVAVFLLLAVGNREFVREHPVATKRFLRAILKATDISATEPRGQHNGWSMAALRIATISRSRR